MSVIDCRLLCYSNIEHLQILFTGFRLLEKSGVINLTYQFPSQPSSHLPTPSPADLLVEVNNSKTILFDMVDFGEIHAEKVDQVDFYFKRSYSPGLVPDNQAFKKVFPLGLMYCVEEEFPSRFALARMGLEKDRKKRAEAILKDFGSFFGNLNPRLFRLDPTNCSCPPDPSLPPGVIFMSALWDPDTTKPKYQSERVQINEMRVQCVRMLRKEFGRLYMGGLIPNDYAKKNFPDCMVENASSTIFGNYIKLLKKYPIGVATTGLHHSIGWKFGEYVAFSRAIVSERLHYEAPGLQASEHYLEFTTPDECVESVAKLFADKSLRDEMMEANHRYYEKYLRPDQLVWNALSIALNS